MNPGKPGWQRGANLGGILEKTQFLPLWGFLVLLVPTPMGRNLPAVLRLTVIPDRGRPGDVCLRGWMGRRVWPELELPSMFFNC